MDDAERAIYRQRIYGAYVTGRSDALAPQSIAGLAPRLPYLRWLVRSCMPADRDAAILDIGCGHGAILYALQQAGYRNARGVDGSAEQVQAAARLGIAGVQQGDLMQALRDATAASLDVVIAFDVIEHFTKAELIPLVDEVHRVLKPGGRWIIHAPNGESPFGRSRAILAITPTSWRLRARRWGSCCLRAALHASRPTKTARSPMASQVGFAQRCGG